MSQAIQYAHLRPLPRCRECDKPATQALYSGVNALISYHCSQHAKAALRTFKARQ